MVLSPFGAYPGTVPGYYASDTEHILELYMSAESETMDQYLEKYVYSVSSNEEFLEKRIGIKRLLELKRKETLREGYQP